MDQEPDIKNVRDELKKQVVNLKTETTAVIESASLKVQGLSAYLSYYDTQELIKLNQQLMESNRKLANATIALAIFTFILAIVTFIKG